MRQAKGDKPRFAIVILSVLAGKTDIYLDIAFVYSLVPPYQGGSNRTMPCIETVNATEETSLV